MNKYDMPIEQWERLQFKSKRVFGSKWGWRKRAMERGWDADRIEQHIDSIITVQEEISERLRAVSGQVPQIKNQKEDNAGPSGSETRSGESGDAPSTTGGDD